MNTAMAIEKNGIREVADEWICFRSGLVHTLRKNLEISMEEAMELAAEWAPEPAELVGFDYTIFG